MRKSRFTEEEILAVLAQLANGRSVREICSSVGVCEATIYRWKATYEGLDRQGVVKLRELEQEVSRLRRITYLQGLRLKVLKAELSES
jgi:putative transposase